MRAALSWSLEEEPETGPQVGRGAGPLLGDTLLTSPRGGLARGGASPGRPRRRRHAGEGLDRGGHTRLVS